MDKLYSIDYEKKYYISDEDMNEKEHDPDKETDIIIDKSLECADEVSECINELPYTRIAQNTVDYDLHIKEKTVPISGTVKVFITDDVINDIIEALEERCFIVSEPELISDMS